jgi:hypothetical protein
MLECVNPKCKKQYLAIGGVMRRCGTCGWDLKPVEKQFRPPEEPA